MLFPRARVQAWLNQGRVHRRSFRVGDYFQLQLHRGLLHPRIRTSTDFVDLYRPLWDGQPACPPPAGMCVFNLTAVGVVPQRDDQK